MKGVIFNIKKYAIHDGPGIRTTVFLKGCPLRCWWCHNPEGLLGEIDTDLRSDDRNTFVDRAVSVKYILDEVKKDEIFYDQSGGGVTFSGGEPLAQPEFLISLLNACGDIEIHRVVDTSGYAVRDIIMEVAKRTDLFLYDLKLMDNVKHIKYTGVSNDCILRNLKTLSETDVQIVIRIPLIPGINDDDKNIEQIGSFVSSIGLKTVNILPYHSVAVSKYHKFSMQYKFPTLSPPSDQTLDRVELILKKYKLNTIIGG